MSSVRPDESQIMQEKLSLHAMNKIYPRLQHIFQFFLAGKLPRDDTMVEKLENWLKAWLLASEDCVPEFLRETGLYDSVKKIDFNKTDAASVAFFLKVLSPVQQCLVSEESVIVSVQWLYGGVMCSALWEAAAVKYAWLRGLTGLLENKVDWVTPWILKEGHLSAALGCLDGGSIFVSQASVNLLSRLVSSLLNGENHPQITENTPQRHNSPGLGERDKLIKLLWSKWDHAIQSKNTRSAEIYTEIVLKTCKESDSNCCILCKEYSLNEKIIKLFDSSMNDGLRTLCLELLSCCLRHISSGDVRNLESVIWTQLETGSLQTAMALAAWLILSLPERLEDSQKLENIIYLPTTYILTSQNSHILTSQHSGILTSQSSDIPSNGLSSVDNKIIKPGHQEDNGSAVHMSTDGSGVYPSVVGERLSANPRLLTSLVLSQLQLMKTHHQHSRLKPERVNILNKVLHWLVDCQPNGLRRKIKQDRVLHGLLDTLHYIYNTHPRIGNIPDMMETVKCCTALLSKELDLLPFVTVQKALQCSLACLVFTTNNQENNSCGLKRTAGGNSCGLNRTAGGNSCGLNRTAGGNSCGLKRTADGEPVLKAAGGDPVSMAADSKPASLGAGNDLVSCENSTEEEWSSFFTSFAHLLRHPSWEVVDSALEFLTQLLQQVQDTQSLKDVFLSDACGVQGKIMTSLDHQENYLRATALRCIAAVAGSKASWEIFTATYPQDIVLEKIIQFTLSNPDAFTRRAASEALKAFYDLDLLGSRSSDVFKVMCTACQDDDWEVKRSTLEFWKSFIKRNQESVQTEIPAYAQELAPCVKSNSEQRDTFTESLTSSGCLAVLLEAINDCDKPVQELACQILMDLKDFLHEKFHTCHGSYSSNHELRPKYRRIANQESNTQNREYDNEERKTLDEENIQGSITENATLIQNDLGNRVSSSDERTLVDLLAELYTVDLEALLALSQLSTDQYALNPMALLDDILSCAKSQESEQSTDGDEDNAIDCY